MSEIESRVAEVVARALNAAVSDMSPEARLEDDLGVDSLTLAQVAMALESEFGVDIPDAKFRLVDTLGEVIALVSDLLSPAP